MSGPLGLVDRAAPEEHRETPEGRTVVVKYGGHAMADEPLRRAFAQDVLTLRRRGVRTVVVHGGG
ncbi:acetylglutamate kinase, partial [Streptomyces halstedii]